MIREGQTISFLAFSFLSANSKICFVNELQSFYFWFISISTTVPVHAGYHAVFLSKLDCQLVSDSNNRVLLHVLFYTCYFTRVLLHVFFYTCSFTRVLLHVFFYTCSFTRVLLHVFFYTCSFTRVLLHVFFYTCSFTRVLLHVFFYTCSFTRVLLHVFFYTCSFTPFTRYTLNNLLLHGIPSTLNNLPTYQSLKYGVRAT